ncbi:interleukin-13 receptor subunit alpha-2 isoform X2 [Chanos chanos]|uniref:Interleukin-13 receptor subunit alpha-2 isoform X2 n=1 Tax=Chanos chanos TaxID=29144 RepID=A0A6J2VY10_CHACN|nr:interleukin-13 receptor subunit alpha-2 isoform X2 [Chanos chanos]
MELWVSWATLMCFTHWIALTAADRTVQVDPPTDIHVSDPGHLGHVYIHWTTPASLKNIPECSVRYQLQFYDTYRGDWTGIRTSRLSYSAQFDLMKPIRVRLRTLLRGKCTNGTEIQSEEVELIQEPDLKGTAGSRITGFNCVYYKWEYMDCTWESGPDQPPHSQLYLYYWHREMGESEECPQYLYSDGVRKGCRFPRQSLLEYSDFNVCVNGSSPANALRPAFFSLQVQMHVKPAVVMSLALTEVSNTTLHLEWTMPEGLVPEHCLEYEVETRGGDEAKWYTNMTEETTFEVPSVDQSERICCRVRSRVHNLCADIGFWSDWSQPECMPDPVSDTNQPSQVTYVLDMKLIMALTIVLIVVFLLSLSLWIFRKMWMNRKDLKGVLWTLVSAKDAQINTPTSSPCVL